MRRLVVAALVVLAAAPGIAAGTQVNATITDVEVSPSNPAPGETVTFTATIRNLDSSTDPLEITSVALRQADTDGINEYTRVYNVGNLAPGTETSLPLTHTFDTAGSRDVRVYVYALGVELRYPVSITVEERHPRIDIETDESITDVESNGTVTLANGLDTDISNVEVSVTGDNVSMTDSRTVFASVAAGETVEAPFGFRPEAAGANELTTTVSYTLPNGTERSVTRNRTIEIDERSEGVSLSASTSDSGPDQTLTVDVLNQGNVDAENVVVTATSANATVDQAIVDSVAAGSSEQAHLNASLSEPTADVTVMATYESGSVERSVNTTTTLRSVPGTIELTGLDVTREGDRLRITGSTSNVGTTAAESVVVRVVSTAAVEPAPPNRDFFVGEVPPSDFSSFDLTARTSDNVSAIPVEVSYLVDGARRTRTFTVPMRSNGASPPEQSADAGGPSAGLLGVVGLGGLALLAVAGVLVRRYRRDDDIRI